MSLEEDGNNRNNLGEYFWGLGYSTNNVPSNADEEQQHEMKADGASGVNENNSTNMIMQQYLQQCLTYHNEQQKKKEEVNEKKNIIPKEEDNESHKSSSNKYNISSNNDGGRIEGTDASLIDNMVNEGRSRASNILSKFQQQLFEKEQDNDAIVSGSLLSHDYSPLYYRDKRDKFLELEEQRKHKAMLKNFDYVLKKQQIQLENQLLPQLSQAQLYEQQAKQRYSQVIEQRKQNILAAQQKPKQKQIRQNLKQEVLQNQNKKRKSNGNSSSMSKQVAIYVSGIPTTTRIENDDPSRDLTDNTLRPLFASYGTIQKIHLYRNKMTGDLKGDGLIIYKLSQQSSVEQLLEIVCSQLNGVELPCGSILQVEPADSTYKDQAKYGPAAVKIMKKIAEKNNDKNNTSNISHEHKSEIMKAVAESKESATSTGNNDDDELDDFFAGL